MAGPIGSKDMHWASEGRGSTGAPGQSGDRAKVKKILAWDSRFHAHAEVEIERCRCIA